MVDGSATAPTGGSGIGLGVARATLQRGAKTIIVGRSREKLASARAALGDVADVEDFVADVAHEGEIVRLYDSLGELDHLVVTAISPGYAPIASIEEAVA